TDANPDGYMITWAAGHSSDQKIYGYLSQMWTELRGISGSYSHFIHYLSEKSPGDPLIGNLYARATDVYHYAHRGILDDHNKGTGAYYNTDVFAGDGGNSNPDPFSPPGDYFGSNNPNGYALQGIVNFLLDVRPSESAFSYGVEMHRSMPDPIFDQT